MGQVFQQYSNENLTPSPPPINIMVPHLPLFTHESCISLIGVELNGGLTDRDEIDMPPSKDGEGYCHTKTYKPLQAEQQAFMV